MRRWKTIKEVKMQNMKLWDWVVWNQRLKKINKNKKWKMKNKKNKK